MPKDEMVYVGHMLDKRMMPSPWLVERPAMITTMICSPLGTYLSHSSNRRSRSPSFAAIPRAAPAHFVGGHRRYAEQNRARLYERRLRHRLGFSDSGASAVDRGSPENRSTRAMIAAFDSRFPFVQAVEHRGVGHPTGLQRRLGRTSPPQSIDRHARRFYLRMGSSPATL